jgi:hypothetical protein
MTQTSRDRVEALRIDAGAHGDCQQVELCDLALAGDVVATVECLRVLIEADSRGDDDTWGARR